MITLIALAITTFTQAQTAIEVPSSMLVQESEYMLQNKMRNGFEIMVQGEAKAILKAFESYLKSEHEFKVKTSSGLITGAELTNIKVSEKRFSLYALIKEEQTAGKEVLKKEKSIGKAEAKLLKSQEKIEKLQVAIEALKNNKVELGTEIESLKASQVEVKGKIESTRETFNQKVALSKQQKANLERLQNL